MEDAAEASIRDFKTDLAWSRSACITLPPFQDSLNEGQFVDLFIIFASCLLVLFASIILSIGQQWGEGAVGAWSPSLDFEKKRFLPIFIENVSNRYFNWKNQKKLWLLWYWNVRFYPPPPPIFTNWYHCTYLIIIDVMLIKFCYYYYYYYCYLMFITGDLSLAAEWHKNEEKMAQKDY